jgi:hypothetical protein
VLSHGAAANKSQFERPTFEGGDKQRFSDPVMGDAVLPAALNWLLITVALNDQDDLGRGITNSPLNDHYCLRDGDMKLQLVQQTTIGLNAEALEEWIEYRKEKGKPLSALALRKCERFLLKYSESHQQHIIDSAIMNDWRGLHPVEEPKQESRKSSIRDDLVDTSWAL